MYNTCASLLDAGLLEVISRVLIDSHIIEVEFVRHRVQFILCLSLDQQQGEKMQSNLTVASKIVAKYIKPSLASAMHDHKVTCMLVLLRKLVALAQYSGNRLLMRQNGLLEVLEVISDKFTGSEVEEQLAGLICILLSDEQKEPSLGHVLEDTCTTDPSTGMYMYSMHT